MMALLKLALFALLAAPALGERRLRGNPVERDQRSLTNTLPFNQKAGAGKHHEQHEEHHGHHVRHLSLLTADRAGRKRTVRRTSGRAGSLSTSRSPSTRLSK
jgi:hypothetical protein